MLREYQQKCLTETIDWLKNNQGNPLVVAPTGSGKSWLIATLVYNLLKEEPHARILILSHVAKILKQNAEKILAVWPSCPLSIYSATLNQKKISYVTIGQIQTVCRNLKHFTRPFNYIIIDECHLIPSSEDGIYRTTINEFTKQNPNLRCIGFTATPYRLKTGLLHTGENKLFDEIASEIDLLELIDNGFLAPLLTKSAIAQADLSQAKIRAGEYVASSARNCINPITQKAIDECLKYGKDRKNWLVFCCDIEHVKNITEYLNSINIKSNYIIGDTSDKQREDLFRKFKNGDLQALVACETLTTGVDLPCIDMIILLRPTQSTSLYVQMLGRGMRPHENKQNCLVMDFAGNIQKHGLIDQISIKNKQKGMGGAAPFKICPACQSCLHTSKKECPECKYNFPPPESKINAVAESQAILSTFIKPQLWPVKKIKYAMHVKKDNGSRTLKVTYVTDLRNIDEYICLEHDGFPRKKAEKFWLERNGKNVPRNIETALNHVHELVTPSEILTVKKDNFFNIISFVKGENIPIDVAKSLDNDIALEIGI